MPESKSVFQGLSTEQAAGKLQEYGFNEIRELLKVSPLRILLRQAKNNAIVYLLIAAMLISFIVGKTITGYAILAVLLIVIMVSFFQEYKAEKAVKTLKQIIMPVSIIIRNGKEQEVLSREIVPEDIIVLRAGEKIPADCLILEEKELIANESVLTGESKEVKKTAATGKEYTNENIVFAGTHIINGKCIAKALHTGMNTEFGKIAGWISTAEKELPLQAKINRIAKQMITIAIIVAVLTGITMVLRSSQLSADFLVEVLIVVIALAISAFPEGLPVVLITTLSIGAHRMAKKNAIVSRMSIIETLGETTVICADKTGTITKGEMTVKEIFLNDETVEVSGAGFEANGSFFLNGKKTSVKEIPSLKLFLKAGVLCNDSRISRKGTDNQYNVNGNPTEAALMIAAAKAGIFKEDINAERLEEIPFNSERKLMSVLCKEGKQSMVFAKGAPEELLKKCLFLQKNKGIQKLNAKEKKKIKKALAEFARKKYRVLALAFKDFEGTGKDCFEKGLVFLGLAAIEDPPREEVRQALETCRNAGINVKMITGDNPETAVEIGKEIGLEGKVINGEEIDRLTQEELSKIVGKIAIFARVRPEHKLKIIKALKQNKEIVTMTGDGINDAPALKEAHIGVAMGSGGTDVAREAADITLKDNNFATIVTAITEGRTIFGNIRTFVTYQLSCNFAELIIIFLGILLGLPLPLLALQILFMNLVTDDLPAITLSLNSSSPDIMKAKPRKKSRILNKHSMVLIAIAATIMAAGTLGVFYMTLNVLHKDLAVARTAALLTLIFFEIANAFNFRSLRIPSFKLSLFSNKYLVYASIISIVATIAVVYTPLNSVLGTSPVHFSYWILAAAISLTVVLAFDAFKALNEKKKFLSEIS